MMNVIDRTAQNRGEDDPMRALDIPPTVMRQLIDLKKLNMIKGEARSIAHPKLGCDIHLQKQRSKKRGGTEWQCQKGDRSPLTEEEMALELISFDEHWMEPDVHKIREDLKRHGYFDGDKKTSDDGDEETLPKKGAKKPARDDDEDFDATPSRSSGKPAASKRPPVDEDEEEETPPPKAKKRPPVDEDEEEAAPPPKAKKPAARPADEDEDDLPPPPKAKKKPLVDEDEDDAPPAKVPSKKKPPVEDDDFDNDFGDV
jgi:hypothetical protein